MLNYWTIAPGEDAIYWDEFLSQSIIGIGWDYLGDISRLNKASIGKQMRAHWHDRSSHKNDVLACIDFAFNLEKGDIIFVKKGLKKMLGYGEVISDYIYDESREHNKSIRKVRWMKTGSWQLIGENRFPLKTLTNVTAYPDYVHKLQGIIEGGVSKLITKYWIFQGNPKIFKMKEYLNSRNVVTWSVNQNKKEIAINDIVFFWMAGPEGSFVAKGKIIEGPSLDIKEDAQELWIGSAPRNKIKCKIQIIERYGDLIRKQELKKQIPDLPMFQFGNATNFKITENQYHRIVAVLQKLGLVKTPPLGVGINTILYGPPGTGKTYNTRKYAINILGVDHG